MKKVFAGFAVALMIPVSGFAQTLTNNQIDQLLQEDLTQLVVLNGRSAVESYLAEIIAILNAQLARFQTGGNSFTNNGHSSNTSVDGDDDNDRNRDGDVDTLSAQDIEEDEAELRGKVTEGDDLRVWFAISRTDKTPSCSTSSQRESVSGRYDDGDTFELVVDNLREDEEYYYRACVEDEDNDTVSGSVRSFETDDEDDSRNNDDEPDVDTDDADDIEDDSAELNGSVDMNDFNNGVVFFVWGEDEDQVEDAADEDTYNDIDEDGDDLQKSRVDTDLDGSDDYSLDIRNLDDDADYYFAMCVEYEDEDDDDVIDCGSVEEFTTDR